MTFRMAIQGIGIVGGFGCGTEAALDALKNPQKPTDFLTLKLPTGTVDYPAYLANPEPLKQFVKPRKLRRVNKYSRLAALAAYLALQDAALPTDQLSETGVIVASGYGASTTTFDFLKDIITDGDSFASPTLFSNSVHSSAASHVTIMLQIKGPCLTVSQFEMSAVAALLNAQVWLRDKKVDTVLLGGVDEINNVLLYCYHNFFGKDIPQEMAPLDYKRQTAIPGEGAAFMVLTRDDGQTPPYGYIDTASWETASEHSISKDTFMIPSCDGHRKCGLRYQKLLHDVPPANIKTFSQLYGSMPSSQMFDLAFASIAAKHGLIPNQYCSIKLDNQDNLALIHHS